MTKYTIEIEDSGIMANLMDTLDFIETGEPRFAFVELLDEMIQLLSALAEKEPQGWGPEGTEIDLSLFYKTCRLAVMRLEKAGYKAEEIG